MSFEEYFKIWVLYIIYKCVKNRVLHIFTIVIYDRMGWCSAPDLVYSPFYVASLIDNTSGVKPLIACFPVSPFTNTLKEKEPM